MGGLVLLHKSVLHISSYLSAGASHQIHEVILSVSLCSVGGHTPPCCLCLTAFKGAHHGALVLAMAHLSFHLVIWLSQPVRQRNSVEQSAKREFAVSMTFIPNEW